MLTLCPIDGNSQRLDGGAMFGNAPRAVWSKWLPPDELGRVPLACRAALVTQAREDSERPRRILLETGVGSFFEPKLRERFGVLEEQHVLLESLAKQGLSHTDVDVVVLSHLHFDHAGGLLASYHPDHGPELLFPNARFVVSQVAFERAVHPHPRDRASFIAELPALLEHSGRLELVPDGAAHTQALGPEFELLHSHGHTPGMLHVLAHGKAQDVFFCADLVPGRPWVHLPITMGYDRYAEALIDEKTRWFERFARERTWLFFTHDPEMAASRIAVDAKGRYSAIESLPAQGPALDLDASA